MASSLYTERREQYRVESQEPLRRISVTIETPQSPPWEAEIVDLSRGGAALRMPDSEGTSLSCDQEVLLVFTHDARPIAIGGQIRSIVATPGFIRFGVEFRDVSGRLAELPSPLQSLFNRRIARRVRPAELVSVQMCVPQRVERVEAALRDISWSGLSIELDPRNETIELEREARVELLFSLPHEQEFQLIGHVQRGMLVDGRLCHGIHFDTFASRDYKRQQLALKRYVARRHLESKDDRRR